MKKGKLKKTGGVIGTFLLAATMFASCGDKDNTPTPGNPTGKNAKITVTVSGVEANDYASFVIVGGDYAHTKTVWKVNGVVQNNETAISLGHDNFTGSTKTYVIESTTPLQVVTVGIQCINFDAPYTISYKAEINGKVETNDANISVEENKDYTHDFSY